LLHDPARATTPNLFLGVSWMALGKDGGL
jgi:hypothetical protein